MKEIKEFKYRPEVDGLRAIAVLAVVMFHAGLGIPGGYVGVDVFFVISGYLITTLVVRDLVNGRFTMLDFWHRRIKRIFPALTVMVLSVLIAGWVCFFPFDYFKLANSTVYQALMIANVYFWKNVGYFSGSAEKYNKKSIAKQVMAASIWLRVQDDVIIPIERKRAPSSHTPI